MARGDRILLGTRKGLFVLQRESADTWAVARHVHVGVPVAYAFEDARDARAPVLWTSLDHGHWGQKLERSTDGGATFEEVPAPAYPEGAEIKPGVPATLRYLWVLAPGGADQPGVLYAGTEPGGLFRSDDNGDSFQLNEALWSDPRRAEGWMGGGRDHPGIHSVLVDPRDSDHLTVAVSSATVFDSRDGGATWATRSVGMRNDYAPEPSDLGHDPHLVVRAPSNPDVLWQQNHFGIFRSADDGATWDDITQPDGPARFGFPIAADERDDRTAWVVPGDSDQKRIAVAGALCVSRTTDAGRTWTELRDGLPQENAFDVVYRHALDLAGDALVFGSTTGNVYASADRGETWRTLGQNFPPVYSVRFA